ncbi:MAG: hypothetical protein HON76_07590 [Candidatus Scalindua sp.]|jgi:type I restriction enzyme S subunit|nr:hypothetical protein [Candidatus Scalindua sp.]MBT6562373.1 hypothetical protein [Candidatus Scalindua sp.]MBT7213052.1 hypothetical protein [Candidatus Scalindua sp.]
MSTELNNIDLTPNQRKAVAELLKRNIPDTEVWAYGSRVKFTSTPKSDLDLVAFATREQKQAISNLKEAFEESSLPFRVDLFIWNKVPEQFHKNIEAERVVLQNAAEKRVIGSEWKEVLLKDVCSKIGSGATPRGGNSVYLSEGEFSLIRSQNVRNDFFDHNGLAFIEKCHADKLSNVTVEEKDVLLNITGDSVARCCQVDPSVLPARVNQHVAIIRPTSTILYAQFLRYYFVSPTMQNEMLSKAGIGATRNALTKGMIENFEIPLPPFSEQKTIAHILGSLDDKIELNRRMNATLEGMVQALFKSWFIDFDPVLDNAIRTGTPIPDEFAELTEVRRSILEQEQPSPNLSQMERGNGASPAGRSGDEGLSDNIRKLFPAAFHRTEELGWIPEGWERKQWGEIAKLEYGKSLKGYRDGKGTIPVYGTNGAIGFTDKTLCNNDGIVIGRKGAYRGVHYSPVPFYVIDTAFYLVPIMTLSNKWAYYEILQYDINGMDSGSAIPSTSRDDFYSLWSTVPPSILQIEFDRVVSAFYEKKKSNNAENASLTNLRDVLLPKLISGELRISEADKLVGEVEL